MTSRGGCCARSTPALHSPIQSPIPRARSISAAWGWLGPSNSPDMLKEECACLVRCRTEPGLTLAWPGVVARVVPLRTVNERLNLNHTHQNRPPRLRRCRSAWRRRREIHSRTPYPPAKPMIKAILYRHRAVPRSQLSQQKENAGPWERPGKFGVVVISRREALEGGQGLAVRRSRKTPPCIAPQAGFRPLMCGRTRLGPPRQRN